MKIVRAILLLVVVVFIGLPGISQASSKSSHTFPHGYCTYYVADCNSFYVAYIPFSGNAISWKTNAERAGFKTKDRNWKPQKYSVMVTSESKEGHVALVKKVSGNSITVTDMNWIGFNKTWEHSYSKGDKKIVGYILPKKAVEQYKNGDKDDKKTYKSLKSSYEKKGIWYDGKKQCY